MNFYYFLTAQSVDPESNPGSRLISDGIKHLVSLADPDAVLQDLTLFSYVDKTWSAILPAAKGIFLCGNPRFAPNETYYFWLKDLLELMLDAQGHGVKVGDLYAGSAYPLPVPDIPTAATALLKFKRNKETLDLLSPFNLLVSRDPITHAIFSTNRDDVALLPDSTFWAKDLCGVHPGEKKYDCVTIPSLNCTPVLIQKLYKFAQELAKDKTTYFLCHARTDFLLARSVIPEAKNLILIYDPLSLLLFYSHVDRLVSCRLHGSIPALSLGARVVNVAMDSRAAAFDNFGFTSIAYSKLPPNTDSLKFNNLCQASMPAASSFILKFKKKILET